MVETKPARRYAGANWVRANFGELSPLGEKVADILGNLYYGIYHMDMASLHKVNWADPKWIRVTISDHAPASFSTFDGDHLTRLVILCHDAAVRCDVRAAAYRYLWLHFTPREREGHPFERHPTMEQALTQFRATEVA